MPEIISDFPSLARALASERKRSGFSQIAFDDRVGLADGHTAKIEAGFRNYGPTTLPLALQALGCVLVLHKVRSVPRPSGGRSKIARSIPTDAGPVTVHASPEARASRPEQLSLPLDLTARAEIARRAAPRRKKVAR